MTQKISPSTAQTEFNRIMDRAIEHDDRFLVERDGEPVLMILSMADYLRTVAPAPDWLKELQDHSKRMGLDSMTMSDIDAEIAAARRDRRNREIDARK